MLLWWAPWRPAANADPFTTKVMASVQFTLLYPTVLPSGYRIDPDTVKEPQSGVVVFTLRGPNKSSLYMSEESRPSTFDIGGYYKNFTDLTETDVSDGVIATGLINNGQTEIASRANDKVWVLANTNTNIPLSQLRAMLESLTPSY